VSTLFWWGVLLVAVSGLFAAPALSGQFPRAWWCVVGFPVLWLRMRLSWRRLARECDLTVMRGSGSALVGRLAVKGRELDALVPHLVVRLPRKAGQVSATVRLLAGQTPEEFVKAGEAMAHAWRVHAVRVSSRERGRVELLVSAVDPLSDPAVAESTLGAYLARLSAAARSRRKPRKEVPAKRRFGRVTPSPVPPEGASVLMLRPGVREDGWPWVMDLREVPHWLVTGATGSGKSNLINALVVELAPRPVALVGVDLKGGLELSPYAPRLSALATTRAETVGLLERLCLLLDQRMSQCRGWGVRSIWELEALVRPVPVVVIVDEVAELYLAADKAGKSEASQCSVMLVRLAQLGRALGLHLIIAGQRVGADLGDGVTALRAQLGGRICHRVTDPGTAVMTLGDLYPDAVEAAQMITHGERGVAITTDADGSWLRARAVYTSSAAAEEAAVEFAHLRPSVPVLDQVGGDR
jgi:DNA segregation ATPase FtsK/SpoIIIE, S-DNA-T family